MDILQQFLVFLAVLCVVAATPIEYGPAAHYPQGKHRVRRQEDVRNCDANPPYEPDTTVDSSEQLANLRTEMTNKSIAAYIIPSEDAHQSEYIAEADERRFFISGFSGSAGLAIVTMDAAAMWVDGRYFLQAKMELDCSWISMEMGEVGVPSPEDWLVAEGSDRSTAAGLPEGSSVGFDPTLLSISTFFTYNDTFINSERDLTLLSIEDNLVDNVWIDMDGQKPAYPGDDILILGTEYTGRTWQQKIYQDVGYEVVRQIMEDKGAEALVIHKLDEIAWLFNLRGKDIPYNPMMISYAIILEDRINLYMYNKDVRATPAIRNHLDSCDAGGATCTTIKIYDDFLGDLAAFGSQRKVWHSDTGSYAMYERVTEENRIMEASPILMMKAIKNPTELAGLRNACWMDSISLCELFAWLQEKVDDMTTEQATNGDINYLSELIIEDKAIEVRQVWGDEYTDQSFHSISAFKDHGAIIHYSSSEATDVPITKDGTYMLDSGAQYKDGTTDITRTLHYGIPTAFEVEAYTRVLLGHIDLVNANFRTGVYGRDIDSIAREPLWSNGLDYRHGTGHGIGHFLNVHEGPGRISIGYSSSEKPMQEGMFFSDEPGYYEDGKFGIRIENDMIVVPAITEHSFSTYEYMTFEMLSLVPFDPNLIDFTMLSPAQLDWYNAYNQRIRDEVGSELTDKAHDWMMSVTKPIDYTFKLNSAASVVLPWMLVTGSLLITRLLNFY